MRISWSVGLFWLVCIVTLLGAGCTPAVEPVQDAVLNLTYTGDGCAFDGPEFLKAGPATLQFFNEGEMQAAINAVKLDEGRTFKDLDKEMGDSEGPIFGHAPEWTQELGTFHWIKPGQEYTWEGDVVPGLYAIAAQQLSGAVWPCGRFTVVE